MKRRAARTDANQTEIVQFLRDCGATVVSLAMVGNGVPDLLVGWAGENILIEVKDGSKPPSRRTLTPDEQEFYDNWQGHVVVAESVDDVIKMLNEVGR